MVLKSKQWFHRHKTDGYVRQAQKDSYRSRAAYKLLEIDEKYNIFSKSQVVIDLGSAPGSWSQIAAQRTKARVIAIDILTVAPIAGVDILTGDFCQPSVQQQLVSMLDGRKVDLVLSDMSANLTGITSTDQFASAMLVENALSFCCHRLLPEGAFVCKIFHGSQFQQLLQLFRDTFASTKIVKPKASRSNSKEVYIYAQNLQTKK